MRSISRFVFASVPALISVWYAYVDGLFAAFPIRGMIERVPDLSDFGVAVVCSEVIGKFTIA